MRVTNTVKARVKATIEKCIVTANAHYDRTFKYPTVIYKKRGQVAGTATDRTYTIDLNSVLLMENVEDFLKRTVIHEFAHLVDGIVSPAAKAGGWGRKRDIHGPRWKAIMRLLGGPTSRCHSYDTTNSKVKRAPRIAKPKHVWKCGCGDGVIKLTARSHKKQLAATGDYGYYKRGHTASRCGKYSYFGLEGMELESIPTVWVISPTAKAANAPRPAPRRTKKVTKLDKCRECFSPVSSRELMINTFMLVAGCTKAGAATYYAKIKKEF